MEGGASSAIILTDRNATVMYVCGMNDVPGLADLHVYGVNRYVPSTCTATTALERKSAPTILVFSRLQLPQNLLSQWPIPTRLI